VGAETKSIGSSGNEAILKPEVGGELLGNRRNKKGAIAVGQVAKL